MSNAVNATEKYSKNTLFEVIFQARFPRILSISNKEPVDFQEIIRKKGFPEMEVSQQVLHNNLHGNVQTPVFSDKEYSFLSENKDLSITLTADFIALTCLKYDDFASLQEKIIVLLDAFQEIYQTPYFNRLGLRYRNICYKNKFNNTDNIEDYIPEYIASELINKQQHIGNVNSFEKAINFIDNDNKIETSVRYIYGRASGSFGLDNLNNQASYFIDTDCFSTEKEKNVSAITNRIKLFHAKTNNMFEWSITEKLREAMRRN